MKLDDVVIEITDSLIQKKFSFKICAMAKCVNDYYKNVKNDPWLYLYNEKYKNLIHNSVESSDEEQNSDYQQLKNDNHKSLNSVNSDKVIADKISDLLEKEVNNASYDIIIETPILNNDKTIVANKSKNNELSTNVSNNVNLSMIDSNDLTNENFKSISFSQNTFIGKINNNGKSQNSLIPINTEINNMNAKSTLKPINNDIKKYFTKSKNTESLENNTSNNLIKNNVNELVNNANDKINKINNNSKIFDNYSNDTNSNFVDNTKLNKQNYINNENKNKNHNNSIEKNKKLENTIKPVSNINISKEIPKPVISEINKKHSVKMSITSTNNIVDNIIEPVESVNKLNILKPIVNEDKTNINQNVKIGNTSTNKIPENITKPTQNDNNSKDIPKPNEETNQSVNLNKCISEMQIDLDRSGTPSHQPKVKTEALFQNKESSQENLDTCDSKSNFKIPSNLIINQPNNTEVQSSKTYPDSQKLIDNYVVKKEILKKKYNFSQDKSSKGNDNNPSQTVKNNESNDHTTSRSMEISFKMSRIQNEQVKKEMEIPKSLIMNSDREDIFEPKQSYDVTNSLIMEQYSRKEKQDSSYESIISELSKMRDGMKILPKFFKISKNKLSYRIKINGKIYNKQFQQTINSLNFDRIISLIKKFYKWMKEQRLQDDDKNNMIREKFAEVSQKQLGYNILNF